MTEEPPFQPLHGKYRLQPETAKPEEGGRRAVPTRLGKTYVPLWVKPSYRALEICDNGVKKLVSAVHPDAKVAGEGFNSDGGIPSGVCNYIEFALDIQKEHLNTM